MRPVHPYPRVHFYRDVHDHARARVSSAVRRALWMMLGCCLLSFSANCVQTSGDVTADNAESVDDHRYWAQRLSGEWRRVDNPGTYDASGASVLKIDTDTFEEIFEGGQHRTSTWKVHGNSNDVAHLDIYPQGKAVEHWRMYLFTAEQLSVFAPDLPPASYVRKESLDVQNTEPLVVPAPPPTAAPGPIVEPIGGRSIVHAVPEQPSAEADVNDASSSEEKPHLETPTRQELEAIFRRMKTIPVSTQQERKRLGERLLIGSWSMAPGTLASINLSGGEDAVPFTDVMLKFNDQWRLTMIWKTEEDMMSDGADWRVEGMYGTEIRVILSDQNREQSREHMKFMDIDHFILDPDGEGLLFQRNR